MKYCSCKEEREQPDDAAQGKTGSQIYKGKNDYIRYLILLYSINLFLILSIVVQGRGNQHFFFIWYSVESFCT